MHVNHPAKALARRLPWLFVLVLLGLLRAERGTAELQGRAAEPSRVLHLTPEPDSEGWTLSLLGHDARVPRESVETLTDTAGEWRQRAMEQLERIREALP